LQDFMELIIIFSLFHIIMLYCYDRFIGQIFNFLYKYTQINKQTKIKEYNIKYIHQLYYYKNNIILLINYL